MLYRLIILTEDLRIIPTGWDLEPEQLNYQLHDVLDGFYEIVRPVRLPKGWIMLVDDEGLLKDLPWNPIATNLYSEYIAGMAIIMKEGIVDGEPDIVGLEIDDFKMIMPKLRMLRDALRGF